jgi:hypothetical protein
MKDMIALSMLSDCSESASQGVITRRPRIHRAKTWSVWAREATNVRTRE